MSPSFDFRAGSTGLGPGGGGRGGGRGHYKPKVIQSPFLSFEANIFRMTLPQALQRLSRPRRLRLQMCSTFATLCQFGTRSSGARIDKQISQSTLRTVSPWSCKPVAISMPLYALAALVVLVHSSLAVSLFLLVTVLGTKFRSEAPAPTAFGVAKVAAAVSALVAVSSLVSSLLLLSTNLLKLGLVFVRAPCTKTRPVRTLTWVLALTLTPLMVSVTLWQRSRALSALSTTVGDL